MKVVSTNIAEPKTIIWKNKEVQTGLYKKSVEEIHLGKLGVKGDTVIEKKVHGGVDKACYLYSLDHYSYWKKRYPNLDWSMGMFGENLTVEGLQETELYIGDTFKVGEAIIQISEPRMPCYKFGLRFGTQELLKQFNQTTFSGAYVRVLQEGIVKSNDQIVLIEKQDETKLSEVFSIFLVEKNNKNLINKVLQEKHLADKFKEDIRRKLK